MPRALSTFILLLVTSLLNACTTTQPLYKPANTQLTPDNTGNFPAYLAKTRRHLQANLIAVDGFPRQDQIEWNMPFRNVPDTDPQNCTTPPTRGILLVHGLSDSPFVFRDFARVLEKDCVEVRTVLLQGHGTSARSGLTRQTGGSA